MITISFLPLLGVLLGPEEVCVEVCPQLEMMSDANSKNPKIENILRPVMVLAPIFLRRNVYAKKLVNMSNGQHVEWSKSGITVTNLSLRSSFTPFLYVKDSGANDIGKIRCCSTAAAEYSSRFLLTTLVFVASPGVGR